MKLLPDWMRILKKAWSIRFMILAGILSAAEIILPLYANEIPRGTFAALTFIAVGGAFVTRLVVQRKYRDEE